MNRILESGQYKALILRGEEIISLQEVMDLPWSQKEKRVHISAYFLIIIKKSQSQNHLKSLILEVSDDENIFQINSREENC